MGIDVPRDGAGAFTADRYPKAGSGHLAVWMGTASRDHCMAIGLRIDSV